MKRWAETAPAKINLALDILRRRGDGFHDMYMIMQTVSLSDEIILEETPEESGGNCNKKLILESGEMNFPADYISLEERAAIAFFRAIGFPMPRLRVILRKSTPAYAGLGGGSADVAALLRLLRQIYAPSMPIKQLETIGLEIGSDIPFCIQGGTAIAEGRGEILTRLPPLPDCYFVICKPDFGIPTPKLFALADDIKLQFPRRPDISGMADAIQNGDLRKIAARIQNVFEYALPDEDDYKAIFKIKNQLLKSGALGAAMSGSGPAVFGLFSDHTAANQAADALRRDYRAVFVVTPRGIENI